ncbi:unnamed protein product [Discula destructiva]
MPTFESPEQPARDSTAAADANISFPPVTRDHILHCSYDYWFPKYRSSCIKSRIIKLPPVFIEYIKEDGIMLSTDSSPSTEDDDDDWEPTSTAYSRPSPEVEELSDSDDEEDASSPKLPPDQRFPELHQTIKDTIKELGGEVAPKLNWSSPKDAGWISPHQNTIKCTTPDDIYLLLKTSNFISHDLDHAFDGTIATASATGQNSTSDLGFEPVLVLRTFFSPQTSMEFRCFVKQRSLIAITPRDLNYYEFHKKFRPAIIERIEDLFEDHLRLTFPDGNFCFDVYVPEERTEIQTSRDFTLDSDDPALKLGRARLIDINPWAPRTDTLLFDWSELLDFHVPKPLLGVAGTTGSIEEGVVRLHLGPEAGVSEDDLTTDEESEDDEEEFIPELRLVEKDDPAAYNFSSPAFSAHKLPKEVVDASATGNMAEFARQWADMENRRL